MPKNSISKKINIDIDDYKKLSEINLFELFLKESIILETVKENIQNHQTLIFVFLFHQFFLPFFLDLYLNIQLESE